MNLKPFFEPVESKPLINGSIVTHGKTTYRVERWFTGVGGELKIGCPRKIYYQKEDWITEPVKSHCYVFVDITIGARNKIPFAKKPSTVQQMIKDKQLIITNSPGWN